MSVHRPAARLPLARVAAPRRDARTGERALIRAAQRGSADAVETLFRREWPRAYRAAFLVVQDRAAAEDIAQEAFLAALRSLDRFDRRRPFGPWMHRIAVNRAIDAARARTLRRELELGGAAAAAAAPDPPAAPLSAELMAAVRGLSPEARAVVALRYLLDMTPGEIAAALDLPRGTVNSRLRRALDRLGELLEDGV